MTDEERRENDEFYAEYQRGMDEARREVDTASGWVNPFAWVEEMTDEEADAWERRLDEARTHRIQAEHSQQP